MYNIVVEIEIFSVSVVLFETTLLEKHFDNVIT